MKNLLQTLTNSKTDKYLSLSNVFIWFNRFKDMVVNQLNVTLAWPAFHFKNQQ
jgi:hypothetical protein